MKEFFPSISFSRWSSTGWVFAVCFAMAFACAPVEDPSDPTQAPALSIAGCEPGDEMYFPLECQPTGIPDPDFVAELSTPTYQSDDCLCEVQHYEFVFSNVAPGEVIQVTDVYGNPLPVTIIQDGDLTRIILDDPQALPDHDLTVEINFVSAPAEHAVPTLEDAGGLCIIDNVGGLPTGPLAETYHAPLILQSHNGSGGSGSSSPGRKAYVPSAMGLPTGR